jgi:hypothetical protein
MYQVTSKPFLIDAIFLAHQLYRQLSTPKQTFMQLRRLI